MPVCKFSYSETLKELCLKALLPLRGQSQTAPTGYRRQNTKMDTTRLALIHRELFDKFPSKWC